MKNSKGLSKSNILINKYIDEIEFKTSTEDFKLYFCPEVINFTNGYDLNLLEVNDTEIKKLLEKIIGEQTVVDNLKSKFKLFRKR